MTTNGSRLGYVLVVAAIAAIGVLAVVFSGRVAAVSAGIGLLALAGLRVSRRAGAAISARSVRFDAALLGLLGSGVLVLALTADNI